MLQGLGALWLGLLAALLVRLLLRPGRRPVPLAADLLAALVAVLAACHAVASLRLWHLAFLSALPAYLATLLTAAGALLRRLRGELRPGEAPGAARRTAVRVAAAVGLALAAFTVVRLVEVEVARERGESFASLGREDPVTVTDLRQLGFRSAFAALCEKLDAEYPFRAWKGLDFAAAERRLEPAIAAAEAHADRRAFYRALRQLAWSIPDGHVRLDGDDGGLADEEVGGDYGLAVALLDDGRLFVSRVATGGSGEAAGVAVGDEVVAWNGAPPGAA
ncbi:MAG TPA: hypothetical protein VGE98_16225, partial [Thermoanaerobaculia bacterium]